MRGLTIAQMYFANPLWGWAMWAAVGVPLLAHLLSQRGGTLAVFPTIRFVRRAVAQQNRWLRPWHLLLLLLRTTVLTLVVAAFARPVWSSGGVLAQESSGLFWVLVLDRSASMNRSYRGTTLFDEARRQVVGTLRQLDPRRDVASVILLDKTPRSLWPEPSINFEQLARLVQEVRPTYQRGDLDAALRLAKAQVTRLAAAGAPLDQTRADASGRRVRIELYSDMQKAQFSNQGFGSQGTANVHLHPIGVAVDNLALSKPTVSPTGPVVGQRATVTVDVAHLSGAALSSRVNVQMTFEGQRDMRTIDVAAGMNQTVGFTVEPKNSGPTFVEFEIPNREPFDLDNRTGLSFSVQTARRVALVTEADTHDAQTAAYYFLRALAPGAVEHGGAGVDLTVWRPQEMAQRLADHKQESSPAAIVIVEAGGLDVATMLPLERYLAKGGVVVWMIDSPQAAQGLGQFAKRHPKVSPVMPRPVRPWVTDGQWTLASGRFEDPVLHVFQGPARGGLMAMSFRAVMVSSAQPSAVTLLRYADGTPALASRWVGAGRLAVFGADLSPRYSDVVKGPLFVPLLHQLVRYLAPGPVLNGPTYPGAVAFVAMKHDNQNLVALGPDMQPIRLVTKFAGGQDDTVALGPVQRPGQHTIVRAGDEARLGGVYVQLDPAESDLRVLPASRVVGPTLGSGGEVAPGLHEASKPSRLRHTLALWPYFAAAAIFLAALEPVVTALADGSIGMMASRAIKRSVIRV